MKFKQTILSVVPFLSLACVAISSVASNAFVVVGDKEEALAIESVGDYDNWIKGWSQSGHMYLHYNRGDNEAAEGYAQYALWLWQHAPKDIDGSLWAYGGKTKVGAITLDPMSTSFMTAADVGGSGSQTWIDQYGAIIDVDMTANIRPGKGGTGDASLTGATELGFLLVQESSMGGATHWSSDGGKNTYLEKINEAPKTNGAIHVYVSTGDLDSYAYESKDAKAAAINPTVADRDGIYNSKTQVIEDGMSKANSTTSDAFKSLGVGYQVFVASFRDSNGDGIGDIRGVINSLDYLQDLGVQALWLTPIQKSDSYHGYDISDYYAVDPKFGTLNDYRELIYKAHKRGMRVLMDLVLNHTSKSNVWFKNSQWAKVSKDENGNDIEWRNVYHWKYEDQVVKKYDKNTGDWTTTITVKDDSGSSNPSWYRDGLSNYYYYGKFGSGMPEINYEYQPTRDLVKNMAKYWLSFGLDGFRLDAVKHIYMKDEVSDTGTDVIIKDVGQRTYFDNEKGVEVTVNFDYSSDLNKNVTWWKEFATELKNVYPNCFLVGENFDGYGNRTAAYYQALDSQFAFNHYYHTASKLFVYGPGAYASAEPLEGDAAFRGNSAEYWVDGDPQPDLPGGRRNDYIDGSFTSNHDVMRAINHINYSGYERAKTGGIVGTIDNDNVTSNASAIGRAKVHGAVTMLTPGVSWIYYGDELGMSSNTNKHVELYGNENSKDIWYRQPFKWGGNAASQTVNYSAGGYKIEWDDNNKMLKDTAEQAADPSSMLRYYQALGKIKNMYPKDARVTYKNDGNVLWFYITGSQGKQLIIFVVPGEWDQDYYAPSYIGIDSLTAGYIRYAEQDDVLGYSGGPIIASMGAGTMGVWYK